MATVTRKGESVQTIGELPALNSAAPEFTLVDINMADLMLADLKGTTVILNVFPSLDTPTCATSVREFNERATSLNDVVVIGVSADLPFAMKRFCTAEGIEHVLSGSTFRSTFGKDYGVIFTTGGLAGLLSRAIVLIDGEGVVRYTEQVPDTSQQPNYDAVLACIDG
jgi:thiol peroxidase